MMSAPEQQLLQQLQKAREALKLSSREDTPQNAPHLEQAAKMNQELKENLQKLQEKLWPFAKELPAKGLAEQYNEEKESQAQNNLLEPLPNGELGIVGIDQKAYPFPTLEQIKKELSKNKEFKLIKTTNYPPRLAETACRREAGQPPTTNHPAFTLIEALVMIFIFSLITATFYSVFSLGTRYIQDSKNRLGAIAIANEKMEVVRNLKYDDIGTTTGIPQGDILADEDVTENAKNFHVKTFVQYVDDPFDGVAPDDEIPNDYKRVKITVSWTGSVSTGEVFLVSRFVPSGMEAGAGDGTLAINVINGQGLGVAQANVNIVNNDVSPQVNINAQTDNAGNIFLPGAKESALGYALTVSKSDYETVETVFPDSSTYIPVDTHASVVPGLLNTKSIMINLLANIKVMSVDHRDMPIPSLSFKLEGGRVLGTDTSYIPTVTTYNMDIISSTGVNGEKNLEDKSPGQYFLNDIGSVSGYTLIGVEGFSAFTPAGGTYDFLVLPDEAKTVKLKFADNTKDALLIKVKKEDGTSVSGASVTVRNAAGYEVAQTSGVDGRVFFPNTADVFAPGDYDIEITSAGFENKTDTVNVDNLTTKEISLIAA